MPEEDGYTFVRRLRSCGYERGRLACLAMTALARPQDKAKAMNAGYDEHLAKPFDAAELVSTARRLIKGSRRASAKEARKECQEPGPARARGARPSTGGGRQRVDPGDAAAFAGRARYEVRTAGSVGEGLAVGRHWPVERGC